jgi:exonuclease SbcC
MLGHLSYSVTFPSTGRTLKGDVKFKNGFGVITGSNEAGKSFIIEVVRYCLFGSAALRGKAEDYKSLKASLTFWVKDNEYEVSRTSGTAKLEVHGACDGPPLVLATGTKPVNAHILSLLGFGLEVFDVACSANQGDIERLGNLKPTERKRMVDEVIGLTKIDEVAKWCGEEARVFERHPEPGLCPTQPALMDGDLDGARRAYEEFIGLKAKLAITRIEPKKPTCSVTQTVDQLRPLAHQERELHAELAMLKKQLLALPPTPKYTLEELDQFQIELDADILWKRKQVFMKRHPRPFAAYTRGALQILVDDWAVVEQRESLSRLVKELRAHGEVDCPNCQHHFYLESNRLDELEAQLHTLEKIVQPTLSRREIADELARHDDWDRKDTQTDWEELKDAQPAMFDRPAGFSPVVAVQAQIDQMRRAHTLSLERKQIEKRISEITVSNYHQAALETRLSYEAQLERYEQDVEGYADWKLIREIDLARAQELAWAETELPRLQQLQRDWDYYNAALASWQDKNEAWHQAQTQALGWRAAQQALNDLRVMVKGHLVPALSRVASVLITQMTGGQRSSIVVDEDFDVTVDGQALGTLSGSGKAVANLALRLGLGQVLTNGVFSIFIGDEIDASMDDSRAENMTNSVRSLVQKISQIIVITHKYPVDADWHINLGNGEWTN